MSDMFSDNVNKKAEKLAAQNSPAESVNESQQNPQVPSTRPSTGQTIGQSIVSTQVTLQSSAMNIKNTGFIQALENQTKLFKADCLFRKRVLLLYMLAVYTQSIMHVFL